jgi:hypothetical protein
VAFKWVQCIDCFNTKHISHFPHEVKNEAGKLGYCICTTCLAKDGHTFSNLKIHGKQFFDFMGIRHD